MSGLDESSKLGGVISVMDACETGLLKSLTTYMQFNSS